ncbi:YadA-like family protein [Pseudomonas sp. NPDC086581]|uniref:YadA-like family protein n=1 Tax=Pseudomonas sp. NPDC086581 TaxID=3364432 RepID=UPI00382AC2AF
MNRIYRLVWSTTRNAWVAASEFATAHRKTGRGVMVGTLAVSILCSPLTSTFAATPYKNGSTFEKGVSGNPGLYVNDASNDSGCIFVHDTGDTGSTGWKYDSNNTNCLTSDKASQTARVLFYGSGARTDGTDSLTLGNELYVNGGRIGLNNKFGTNPTNSMAIGNIGTDASGNPTGTRATAQDSVAIGNDAVASQQNAMALGTGAQANVTGGVALGSGSVAGTVAGQQGYLPSNVAPDRAAAIIATTGTLGAIAVGDATTGNYRQITGLAAGTLDSDAVNVAQLKGVTGQLAQDALLWDPTADNGQGAFSANHGGRGPNKISNVAAGDVNSTSTDAVNGSQLYQTNQNVTNVDNRVSNVFGDDSDSNVTLNGRGIRYVRTNDSGLPVEDAYARGQGSTAVGYQAQATGDSALALGRNATASTSNSVALGANSSTGTDLNRPAYMAGGHPPRGLATGEVSVGAINAERRITNLAAGADDTDAVNVSQLRGVADRAEQLSQDALLWDWGTNSFSANHYGIGPNKITNVAAGDINDTSTDAVNGSQLSATNTQVTNLDGRVTNVEGDVSDLGDHVDNIYKTGTKYFHANSTGTDSAALGQDSVAIGMGAVSSHDGSVALGAGSIADGSTLGHQAYLVGGTATGEVNVGNRRVTGVAAGAEETDAVNVSQLKGVADRTDQLGQDALLWDPTANGGNGAYNANHGGRGPSKITNVASGDINSTSTDAVNGSQLYEVTTQINSITLGGIKYFHASSQKPDSVASGTDSIAVGPAAQASGTSSLAMGDGANASASNASAVGSSATASGDSATAVGTGASATGSSSVAMGDGAAATGERSSAIGAGASAEAANSVALGADSVADRDNSVSVGSAGNERQITNVKAGEADTDAVNVSQLRDHGDTINSTINNVDNRVTQAKTDITQLQNGTDGMFQVNNSSNLPKPRPTGTDAVAGGAGAEASGNNSAAIGTRARASGANATALGNGSSAQAQNSVAVGANSVADRANSVSVGSAGNERQITNVAAGTAPTDAVNVSQLQQSMGDISNQFYDYTDSRYNALRHDLKKQDDILSAGIAGAMAMATLPQPHSAGASMATVGLGNYRGQGALAIGVSRISDNGKWVTKLQGSTSSQGDAGVAVGLGYQW